MRRRGPAATLGRRGAGGGNDLALAAPVTPADASLDSGPRPLPHARYRPRADPLAPRESSGTGAQKNARLPWGGGHFAVAVPARSRCVTSAGVTHPCITSGRRSNPVADLNRSWDGPGVGAASRAPTSAAGPFAPRRRLLPVGSASQASTWPPIAAIGRYSGQGVRPGGPLSGG